MQQIEQTNHYKGVSGSIIAKQILIIYKEGEYALIDRKMFGWLFYIT